MAIVEMTERDKRIYDTELKDFLPERMLDVHSHVFNRHILPPPDPNKKPTWASIVMKEGSIESLEETYKTMLPGKKVSALMFTAKGAWEQNNAYVSAAAKKNGWYALYYSHPDETGEDLKNKIRGGGFLGIKSYLSFAPKYIPRKEVRVFDFFPKAQLETLNELGGIVMLHIPRDGRLRDPVNLEQILEIKREFPRVRLIVAHIGRAYTEEDVGNAFTDYLDKAPDLMYDFSANCCDFAIREVIKHAGTKHVMWGTDMPVQRMRTHRITENGTYINLVPPGLYGGSETDPHLREVSPEEAEKITFFLYEELLSFKRVFAELRLTRRDVEDILYNNAADLIEGARRDIYGE